MYVISATVRRLESMELFDDYFLRKGRCVPAKGPAGGAGFGLTKITQFYVQNFLAEIFYKTRAVLPLMAWGDGFPMPISPFMIMFVCKNRTCPRRGLMLCV